MRRNAQFIEESLYRGTKWVVFEPNEEALLAQVRLVADAFTDRLFRQGAFLEHDTARGLLREVRRRDDDTGDINRGILNILIGFAPLKPAEFVVIKIQQLAQQA